MHKKLVILVTMIVSGLYKIYISKSKRFVFSGKFFIFGVPIVDVHKDAKVYIGNNVTLNSTNWGYHAGMYAPVKLMADRAGAEIRIGNNTRIHGSCLHAFKSISVGEGCLIAANCQILDGSGHDLSFPDVENRIHTKGDASPVRIGDNVWIGLNCIVLPGSVIGSGSVIAAGSVVRGEIPPMSLVAGVPAKVVKTFSA